MNEYTDTSKYTVANPSVANPSAYTQYSNGSFQFVQPNLLLAQIQPGQIQELMERIRQIVQEEIQAPGKSPADEFTSEMINKVYRDRNMCVALLVRMALALGLVAGVGHDPEVEAVWANVAFIDLPTGQVSWHIHKDEMKYFEGVPAYTKQWDGHDEQTKDQRLETALMGTLS